jgi:putative two-component system response regulator
MTPTQPSQARKKVPTKLRAPSVTPAYVEAVDAGGDDPERALPLLVVDDDDAVRRALSKVLTSFGYVVRSADSGEAALAELTRARFALVLCDVRMPGLDGVEVVRVALDVDPGLGILMVTAAGDAATATAALTAGAWDYLMKPVEAQTLRAAVQRALRRREATIRRTQHAIEREVAARTAALHTLTVNTAEALLKAMETKDPYLTGHSQRMAELAESVARALGLNAATTDEVRLAARLADVGKIGLRSEVMNKPGPLTPEEFDHVQDHVRLGMEILSPLSHLGVVLEYVRDHHEHYDGTGYPRAVAGDAISIGGRILAAADAFVALTSRRAYREPMSPVEALDHLRGSAGTLLDWSVYAALRSVVESMNAR